MQYFTPQRPPLSRTRPPPPPLRPLRRQRHASRPISRHPTYRTRTRRRRTKPLSNDLLRVLARCRYRACKLAVIAAGVVELVAGGCALQAAAGDIFAGEAGAAGRLGRGGAGAGGAGEGGGGAARGVEFLLGGKSEPGGGRGVKDDAGEVADGGWVDGDGVGGGGEGRKGGVGGVGGGVLDTEGGGGEDGVGGVGPEVGVVEDCGGGVEDPAVGGFVGELKRDGFAGADLVAQVEG